MASFYRTSFYGDSTLNTRGELIDGLLQFVTLAEGERKLLAADLHDQTLSDLRELARLARRLFEKPEDAMTQECQTVAKLIFGLEAAMDEVRAGDGEPVRRRSIRSAWFRRSRVVLLTLRRI
jgi:hypothetical protein